MMQVLTETATQAPYDFSQLDFSIIQTTFVAALGATAAIVIGMLAIRKGWAFIKKSLRGA